MYVSTLLFYARGASKFYRGKLQQLWRGQPSGVLTSRPLLDLPVTTSQDLVPAHIGPGGAV